MVVGFADVTSLGRFSSNVTFVPAISAAPLPLVFHFDPETESKTALARQQIQIVKQRLNKVLE